MLIRTVNTLMNLPFWGCEAWSYCTTLNNKLEVFLQLHSRRILIISMLQMKDDHIRQADIRERSYNFPSADIMIAARQIIFIGKKLIPIVLYA